MKNVEGLRYKRTLFVGLGGAGAKTLRKLKAKIVKANDGRVPKQVKFLLIDTNATELSNYRDFDSSEKVCIAVREPYQRYLHDLGTSTHEYIPEQNAHSLMALERGAGQVRSNGHFAVIENQYSNKLMRIFRETADELGDIDVKGSTLEKDPKIEVRLAFSIAGGTGSGTFLPIATIIRAAIKHCELTAYIYSATHYSKKVENSAKYSVMQNAYAAICELDYMMHFGRDKRHSNITFNFGPDERQHIEQIGRPFEEVYYIDRHTSYPNSDSVEFAYNELERLQENTAESMHIAASNIISAHTGTVDNVRQKIMEGQFDVGDKLAWISGFGIAELYLKALDRNNPEILNECCESILARTNPAVSVPASDADAVATSFIQKYKWDESQEEQDGDPILRRFLTKDFIHSKSEEVVYSSNLIGGSYRELNMTLDSLLLKQNKNAGIIVSDSVEEFRGYINGLMRSLIDSDAFDGHFVHDFSGKGAGLSLNTVKLILEKINEKLTASYTQISSEKDHHNKERDEADKQMAKVRQSVSVKPKKEKTFWQSIIPFGQKSEDTSSDSTISIETVAEEVKKYQSIALENNILSQRDERTIEIFDGCIKCVEEALKQVETWREFLAPAYEYGSKHRKVVDRSCDETEVSENRVEVQMMDIQGGFRIKYNDLRVFEASFATLQSDQSKFDAVCKLLSAASGSLQDYLTAGLKEISSLTQDGRIKVERTECQQKIDRLIDLSTPTMQVDGHGYGEKVKVDHFWYIMADCPEVNFSNKAVSEDNDTRKSVGALLKTLIEQNSLDAKINLVHVPGWKDKAIVYRVDSAVPAYFVEGVSIGCEGGYTLEGCYEELKKTKRTYTPFSHEVLRRKLENGRSVLKPHDDMALDEAMEYWVNFNLLGLIHFDSEKGSRGSYSIKSEKMGEILTKDFADMNKILLLGESRKDAYESFARYCKTLLEEYVSYTELTDPLEITIEEYKKQFIISGEEYMNRVLPNLKWTRTDGSASDIEWTDLWKHLSEDDPEYEFLRQEMAYMNNRTEEFAKTQAKSNIKKVLSDSYK